MPFQLFILQTGSRVTVTCWEDSALEWFYIQTFRLILPKNDSVSIAFTFHLCHWQLTGRSASLFTDSTWVNLALMMYSSFPTPLGIVEMARHLDWVHQTPWQMFSFQTYVVSNTSQCALCIITAFELGVFMLFYYYKVCIAHKFQQSPVRGAGEHN